MNTEKNPPLPEPKAFLLSQWVYEWVTPFVWKGYKQPLQQDDLYSLTEELKSETLAKEFQHFWDAEASKGKRVSLTLILHKMFGRRYYTIGIFHLLQATANIASPVIIQLLTQFAVDAEIGTPQPDYIGYVYAVIFFLLQLLASFWLNRYFYYSTRMGMKVRVCLTSVIYRKMMKLSSIARQEFTSGRILNMISSDLTRIEMTVMQGHYLWSGPLQIIAILTLLIINIGPSALAGVLMLILMIPIQAVIFFKLGNLRKDVASTTDSRVRLTQEFLQGMKIIKLFAWEESFLGRLMDLRATEVKRIQFVNIWSAVLMGLATSIPTLACVVSFIVYAFTTANGVLSAPIIFSALALFGLLRFPMIILPNAIRWVVDSKIALKRIGDYLNANELDSIAITQGDSEYSLEITNASFKWEVLVKPDEPPKKGEVKQEMVEKSDKEKIDDKPTLKEINLKIKKGTLVGIVGPVGSGKTALLNAILGEIKQVKGDVVIRGTLGYSLQQPWIQNGTLRKNITFGNEDNEDKYNEILSLTTLDKDIQWLPGGSDTLLGEKGVQISGGQKARVSLARVMYNSPDIILLDDPLSAVDVHVGKKLFNDCIRKALKGKTILLVTHQLDHLRNVDYVVYMKDGRISEQGTFDELMKLDGDFAHQIKTFVGESTQSPTETGHQEAVAKKVEVKPTQKMIEEERVTGSVSSKVYWSYIMASGGIPMLIIVVFTVTLSQATRIGNDLWLVAWSSGFLAVNWNLSLTVIAVVYFIFGFAQGVMTGIFGAILSIGFAKASNSFHKDAIAGVFRSPMSFFDKTPLGRMMNRFSKDTDTMDVSLPSALQMFLSIFAGLLGTLGLMCGASYYLIIPLVPLSIVYYFMQLLYVRTSRELKRLESISRSPIFAHFSESMNGLSTIRAYGSQMRFLNNCDLNLNTNTQANYLQLMVQRWLGIRLEFIGALICFFTALFAVISSTAVGGAPTISAALIGISLSYSIQVTSSLNFAVRQAVEVEVNANSIERLHHYARNLDQEAPCVIPDNRPPDDWPKEGAMKMEGLEIKYDPLGDAVIKGISLDVKAQEKIGIVGRTGAGKSTITCAIFRLQEPSAGTIVIDGIDVLKIGLSDLRRKLAIIPQDPVLFSGTIRSNLDPFGDYSDEEIWSVLAAVNMKTAISEKPDKLESKVETNGENYSSGQRQLICLARAMLRKPKLLIMDEATANVDMQSDEFIQRSLRKDFTNSTILTIAHRLNTVIDYDRILVLNQGRVEQFDSPYSLLNDQKGMFAEMVNNLGSGTAEVLKKIAREKHEGKSVALEKLLIDCDTK